MMRNARSTYIFLLTLLVLALSACAPQPTRPGAPSSSAETAGEDAQPSRQAPAPAPSPVAAAPGLDVSVSASDGDDTRQFTGVAVCDEYLASYRACHRVIGAYAPSSIDERLEMLRTTWQEIAADPARSDRLLEQCQSLTDTMKEALNGRACTSDDSDFVQPTD